MRTNFNTPGNVNYFFFSKCILTLFSFSIFLSGCSALTDSDDEKDESLYVKFINSPSSQYTITCVELQAMGRADETGTPDGDWSDNLLKNGEKLTPGNFVFFTLDIPNLHYSVYRVGVEDVEGNEIMLHTQENYQGLEPTITHWGSDERTVEVTVTYDEYSNQIQVNGWSDWAGID